MPVRRKTIVLVLAALASLSVLAGIAILVVSSAHGHGLAAGDRQAVIGASMFALGCVLAAGMIARRGL